MRRGLANSHVLVVVAAAAVLLLGLAATWHYLPRLKQAYWALLATNTRLEPHGASIFRPSFSGTPYQRWLEQARTRLPIREGLVLHDIENMALASWPDMGQGVTGLYLRFADYEVSDGRIIELPARGRIEPQRHLFEASVYFLGGPGHALFFREGREAVRIDWQARSLLSVPLNTRYQFFSDSDEPVRLLVVTSFPLTLNAWNSLDFARASDFAFGDRFDGDPAYFQLPTATLDENRTRTNFVPDALTARLAEADWRGRGNAGMAWSMAGNRVIDMHASEMPPAMYKKAHRHSTDAFILILSGEGYSLVWPGDNPQARQRIDWRRGTLFVPPTYWYHQHLNTGAEPARYLALAAPTLVQNLGLRFSDQLEVDAPGVRAEWEATRRERTLRRREAH